MAICPECGGELRFDIATQSLRCPFCDQKKDPRKFTGYNTSAEETRSTEMDVILYTCPQCGGSIYSTEQSINGFCSFCGSYVMLESRFSKMKYPKYVIPFSVDKERCKEHYRNYVKKALFAPSDYKDPGQLDNFRGIYMSYWGYDVTMEGFLSLDGTRGRQKYKCMGWLNAVYNNIFFDASSAFADRYSEEIAPYNYGTKVEFSPAYLTGFYADLPDLPDTVYEEEALNIAKNNAYRSSRLNHAFPDMSFDKAQEDKFHAAMDSRCSATYTTFFPVWFMSWQKNGRVSYAVVNGQTGRVSCDLPVDFKKFMLSGILLSIPIILLLFALPPFSKSGLLITSETLALFSVFLLMHMIQKVMIRNEMLDDKGFLTKSGQLNYRYRLIANADRRFEELSKKGLIPVAFVLLICAVPLFFKYMSTIVGGYAITFAIMISIVIEIVVLKDTGQIIKLPISKKGQLLLGLWIIFGASLYGTFLILSHTAHASQIQLVVSLQLLGTLIAQLMTLEQYNLLSTRPLSQLNRKEM
ncbi:MAG: hypothetical protein K6B69_04725 [Lachnospiraceae bacterium]|nr:hypothetical protein [Lachnospiraceae bacterium]